MTTLCIVPRTMREDVSAYCAQLGLSHLQTQACLDVARAAHSAREGMLTADRIHDKLQAIRSRNFPPRAA